MEKKEHGCFIRVKTMELRFKNEFEWLRIGSPNGHRFVDITCDTIKGCLVIRDALCNKIEIEDWCVFQLPPILASPSSDDIFIRHIENHLTEMDGGQPPHKFKAVCNICGRSAEQIIAEAKRGIK